MACKRSEQCEHADICQYAKSNAYDILGGSCYRPKKPQTNEEYLRSLNTGQLAGWIADVCYELQDDIWRNCEDTSCDYCQTDKEHWVEWLKQPHTIKE